MAFDSPAGEVTVVDGVSLTIPRGKTVALVGESGCGKSVTALSVMRLIPTPPGRIAGGQVLWHEAGPEPRPPARNAIVRTRPVAGAPRSDGIDLLQLTDRDMRRLRGNRIAMVFQEPLVSLNPVYTIGEQIIEAVELHQRLRGRPARQAAVEALRRVGIPDPGRRIRDYPHHLSGGMRQRVMIAMALACRPALLIADEPTTALDVTVQAQILDLLRDVQAESGLSLLLITHDLGVVAETADDVYVMYAGRIVEHAPTADLFAHPLHPYTQGLLRCMPRLGDRKARLEVIPGGVPDPSRFPRGCRFHPRCALSARLASDTSRHSVVIDGPPRTVVLRRCVECFAEEPSGPPPLRELRPAHHVACWEA